MRTLKKTLCLVLCLAMMVGLCAMGASAAEMTDKADIKYAEAVEVLAALKVLEGYEDGSFRPANELTRAEGAAIMTRLLAAKPTGTSSFTDMGDAAWAQPYVAYCEAMGIINGYGDGRFGPNDKLTTAQFAKMLICALGYDAGREGMTGNTWEIGVAKLVNKINLAARIDDFSYSANVTRDAAAQLSFNTLQADMWEYTGALTVDQNGNFANEGRLVANTAYEHDISFAPGGTDGIMQFCENYFANLKVDPNCPDAYGINRDEWFMGTSRNDTTKTDAKIIAKSLASTTNIMATYTKDVTYKTIFDDSKWAIGNTAWLDVYENGAFTGNFGFGKADTTVYTAYAGATMYLVDDDLDGEADNLIVEYPYLAFVTKVVTTPTRTIYMTVYNGAAGGTQYTFETNDFAQGDYLLVYLEDSVANTTAVGAVPVIEAKTAEKATGNLAKVTRKGPAAGALEISGVSYSVGNNKFNKLANTLADYEGNLNKDVTAFLSNGFVIGFKADGIPMADYVFVAGKKAGTGTDEYGTAIINSYGIVKQDGSTETIKNRNDYAYPGWYKSVNSVAFTAAGTEAVTAALNVGDTVKSTQPLVAAGITANDKTVFILHEKTGYNVYTGISKLPSYTITAAVADKNVYGLISRGVAVAVYMDLSAIDPDANATNTVYVLTGAPAYETKNAKGQTIYTYNIVKDGKLDTFDSTVGALAAGLQIPNVAGGYVQSVTASVSPTYVIVHAANKGVRYNEGVMTWDDYTVSADAYANAMTVATDCSVYIVNTRANTLTVGTPADISGMQGTLTVIKDTAGKVKTVYFLDGKVIV